MTATKEHKQVTSELVGQARRDYMQALLTDLRALKRMVAEGLFERGVSRIGAEQELFLVDGAYHPAPGALDVLARLDDPKHYTTELGLFNLEMNADPQPFAGDGLRRLEDQLTHLYDRVRVAAEQDGRHAVLVGILPTIGKTDLGLENMVPNPRYLKLSQAMFNARGEAFDFSIQGLDELAVKHDSVMVEACNASFQVHLQIAEPERFAHCYNVAQMLLAPVLAAGTNSPVLFGRRLWAETRIALFEQACDIRTPGLHLRDAIGRVSFGRKWLTGGVADLFKENIARFSPLVGGDISENPIEALNRGEIPELRALRLHNGTIYRWNRACYGISENGKPHLRIELRVLPSGPTIPDEVANGALWLGLMSELCATLDDVTDRMDFDHARGNLYAAARDGLGARFMWLDGEEVLAQPLLMDRLIPLAQRGLDRAGVHPDVSKRYIGILERRVRSLKTGSRWILNSLREMSDRGTRGGRLSALVAATIARQTGTDPISEWPLARLDENDSASSSFQKISQYMNTDIVTVRPDDPVELVAEMMGWERIRYVPVEDERGKLVGLVSYRAMLRHLSEATQDAAGARRSTGASVADIMRRDLITVTPDTPTRDAVALIRKHRIGSLPVVQDGHIVAMLTEEDFVGIVSRVLDSTGNTGAPAPLPPEDTQ